MSKLLGVNRLALLVALMIQGTCLTGWAQDAAVDTGLTRAQRETLQNVVAPAYWRGDIHEMVEVIPPLLVGANQQQLQAMEDWTRSAAMPALPQLLAESRYRLAIQQRRGKLRRVSAAELVMTLPYFRDKLRDVLEQRDAYPMLDEPLPDLRDFIEYRDLLWKMHVYDNELANHVLVANYAARLTRVVSRAERRRLAGEQKELLDTRFADIAEEIQRTRVALHESELAVRLQRLEYAVQRLASTIAPEPDQQESVVAWTKERLMSAFAVATDGQILQAYFGRLDQQREKQAQMKARRKRSSEQPELTAAFGRSELNREDLLEQVTVLTSEGHELAGDLIEKSLWLFDGLRWWSRGRYGRGPEAFGLLKNNQALDSDENMTAISMPMQAPTPTEPALVYSAGQLPDYDRRHKYIWTLDDRRFYDVHRDEETVDRKKLGEREKETEYFY